MCSNHIERINIMKRKESFFSAVCITIFIFWTVALSYVDVMPIGPNESKVGFSTLNSAFHTLTGVNMQLYNLTDILSIVPIGFVFFFAVLGLIQWYKRKSMRNIDFDILMLGVFYIVVFLLYMLFEIVVVNYRPVLIQGVLEASYPSSTTFLVMTVMPTSIMQFKKRIVNKKVKTFICSALTLFTVFMVVGRLISGVHWITDIIGGILLSAGIVFTYKAIYGYKR